MVLKLSPCLRITILAAHLLNEYSGSGHPHPKLDLPQMISSSCPAAASRMNLLCSCALVLELDQTPELGQVQLVLEDLCKIVMNLLWYPELADHHTRVRTRQRSPACSQARSNADVAFRAVPGTRHLQSRASCLGQAQLVLSRPYMLSSYGLYSKLAKRDACIKSDSMFLSLSLSIFPSTCRVLVQYPELAEHHAMIGRWKGIQAYLASPRRSPWTLGTTVLKDNQLQPAAIERQKEAVKQFEAMRAKA